MVASSGVVNAGGRACIIGRRFTSHRNYSQCCTNIWRDIPMGSDGVFTKTKTGISGFSPPRKWPSPLLSEEVSLQTLADTTYVRLMHPDDVMRMCRSHDAEGFEHDVVKGTRAGTAWSWLKRPVTWNGRDFKETVQLGLAKSKSHNTWAWLGRPPADEYQFDPTKRWPQGWRLEGRSLQSHSHK